MCVYIYIYIHTRIYGDIISSPTIISEEPLIYVNNNMLTERWNSGFLLAFKLFVATTVGESIVQRIVTSPVDFYWNCPKEFQWHFPMDVHVCEIWCVKVCPEPGKSRSLSAHAWTDTTNSRSK